MVMLSNYDTLPGLLFINNEVNNVVGATSNAKKVLLFLGVVSIKMTGQRYLIVVIAVDMFIAALIGIVIRRNGSLGLSN